ncbi:MAG: YeeE/YedE family protein [Deltaproteobacteria bacterium]|nr:YeeE/YedE family protein [Deltaproteobacteria bacterium]MBW2081236.1 YeeE/YedE family protein [Deltaproteobacteria bacterium]
MSEGILGKTIKGLYKALCQEEWNATVCGIVVALLSIICLAWARPWGAVGAIRNWGEWILYYIGIWGDQPASVLLNTGSVIGLGFVAGAFISACMGGDFAIRIPPRLELAKGVFAGIFMGIGSAMCGGCNIGGFYNAVGNLSASGFCMMIGLVVGAVIGIRYLYFEMEYITWGSGGAKTIEFPYALKIILGIVTLGVLIWGTNAYAGSDDGSLTRLAGLLIIPACLGYTMQRGRWCMIQGFREPHMTGDTKMAKSVILSVAVLAIGVAVLKYPGIVPDAFDLDDCPDAEGFRSTEHYVRGFFGWVAIVGGVIFGFGALLAGGCGTGVLWRVGEGQIKLWVVLPIFGITNAFVDGWFKRNEWEEDGVFGSYVYMPDTWLGYGGTLALIFLVMALWYIIISWNEESEKLIVPM